MKIRLLFTFAAAGLLLISCSSSRHNHNHDTMENSTSAGMASAPVIIYKTRTDYSDHVPVTMDVKKAHIVSFPAQSDLKRDGGFSYPTRLANGWLLDNRGITPNSVFLRFTYDDYYNMDHIPTAQSLMNYITDKDPFTRMYKCGRRNDYQNIEDELNAKIRNGKLDKCERLIP